MNNPLFRPPAEAESLILQVDQGCPHNRCTFCGMYRRTAYRRLPMGEVRRLIQHEARRHPDARRVFLADGDVMCRPFSELRDTLLMLNESLPHLVRIGVYANGRSIAAKTASELCALRQLRLHTLYMGLESGDEVILERCRKGDTVEQMVQAGIAAQSAGLRMSVMILLGLGGRDRSAEHVQHTAEALNRMRPRLLSALRVIPVAGTELGEDAAGGRFRPLTEWQAVDEMRSIVERLDLEGTVFRANHSSNVVPLEGRLPRDKGRLLAGLDLLLASDALDRESPGPMPMWL